MLQSEERLRLAAQAAKFGVHDYDPIKDVSIWTPELYAITGVAPGTLLRAEVMHSNIHPEDRQRIRAKMQAALDPQSGGSFAEEFRIIRADNGETRWIYNECQTLFEGVGAASRAVRNTGVVIDITERKRVEEALRDSERRLSAILEALPIGVALVDVQGHVQIANEVFTRYVPKVVPSRDEARYSLWEGYDDEGSLIERRNYAAARALRGERVWPGIDFLFHGDASRGPVWTRVAALPFRNADGAIIGATAVIVDIDAEKRARDALRDYAEQLKAADKRKDDFIAMLSHELRNPLAPISSAAQILKTIPTSDSKVQWCQELIERQIAQMSRLMEDLLDMSRITSDKLELRKERVELHSVIDSAIETSRPLIEESSHKLIVDLTAQEIILNGDVARLTQVFSNLINNASKYSERGGKIEIRAKLEPISNFGFRNADLSESEVRKSEIRNLKSKMAVVVSVVDAGIGIAAQVLPHMFERFYQADSGKERRYGGLGIGLSLVRGIVELHGGSVGAKSEGLGKGSEFIVRLPILDFGFSSAGPLLDCSESEQGKQQATGNSSGFGVRQSEIRNPKSKMEAVPRKRVVVVDDNQVQAKSLAMLIEMMGFETRYTFSGADALKLITEYKPQVALIDIGLPDMKGYEVAQRVRALAQNDGITLIAQTGWGREEDQAQAKLAGFDHHLTKPIDHRQLENILTTKISDLRMS